ncbi:uncharacterized protein LOC123529688 isoform X2 [Mercenaria mercenaria]|uniref:uncharacterized protein LOC123529688 isoform X2 n=1 Tax=Mercenaria mercenaria TaxID=6596 RepID=UPI00234F5852|nr:uncharacterized protein LOC123529688 isoform X2 [Mercenaria mercenaria]
MLVFIAHRSHIGNTQRSEFTCARLKQQNADSRRKWKIDKSTFKAKPKLFCDNTNNRKRTIKNLLDEQRDILSRYPRYEDFEMPANRFHLTLTVLQLDNESNIRDCVAAMEHAKPEIEKLAKMIKPLEFQGLGCFSPRVIFAKVKFPSEFMELVDVIKDAIKGAGIKTELRPPKLHVTLFNVDKETYSDRRWYKGKIILASLFDPDPYFGSQPVNNIQICEMHTLPTEEGETDFYRSIFNLQIDKS